MAQVGIVMGSDSDLPVMAKAADLLEELGISYEMRIISAHREPDVFFEYAKTAEEKGFKVIIAGAGMAAHLPGMCAAIFPMPVIGIPMHTTSLGAGIPSIRLFRCLPEFRWRLLLLTEGPMRDCLRRRFWQPRTGSFLNVLRRTAGK